MLLHKYWITFKRYGKISPLNIGCGVTAQTSSEAIALIESKVFPIFGEREIESITEDVKIDNLDAGHVLTNLGNTEVLGVWFPALA